MARCRGPVNRLMMLRKRGLSGPFMQNIGGGVCAQSMGNYYDIGGPGSGPRPVAGWTGPMLGCDYVGFLAVDTFTNIPGVHLVNHIPDMGGPWIATSPDNSTPDNTAFQINDSNQARSFVDAKGAVIDCGESDVDIRVDWMPGATNAKSGIIFRGGSPGNMLGLRIRLSATTENVELVEWDTGVVATIGSTIDNFGFVVGTTYNLRVLAVGSSLKAFIDDVEIFDETWANFQTNTNHGIVVYGTDNSETFDNFSVRMP